VQEGARENRWVLYLRGPNLAIGMQEMNEWPGTPRFEESVEFWVYQAALDQGIYPRKKSGPGVDDGTGTGTVPLTAARLKERCWPAGAAQVGSEDLERYARSIWSDLSRPRLETVLRDGVRDGVWCVWKKDEDETFYTRQDAVAPSVQVSPNWALVDPAANLAQELDNLRPGKGPQPVTQVGTPREALTALWDALAAQRNIQVDELSITVEDRESFDNTLLATWADRPRAAQVHASLVANGQRVVGGKTETVSLSFEGRFEEIRSFLAPVWPFRNQGELQVTISVRFKFQPAPDLTDADLGTYRTALVNANQGRLEVKLVPVRARRTTLASGGRQPPVPREHQGASAPRSPAQGGV
jgi:hypothetical protein